MTLPEPTARQSPGDAPGKPFCLGLLRRRECLVPTLGGWAALFAACVFCALAAALGLEPFLAPNDPQSGGVLVVEGWASDFTLAAATDAFRHNHYEKLYVTGSPIAVGGVFSEYATAAEMGAATLRKMGLATNEIQAVPAAGVVRDRTYTSAICLKRWLNEHGISAAKINLITEGAHARRSRLLYEKAFGPGVAIGVVAVPEQKYDSARWWTSCLGTRDVLGEALAYGYAKLLFHPAKE